MAYIDLVSGEIYGQIIYQDAACVVFWTDGRESQIDRDTFDQVHVVSPDEDRDHNPADPFTWRAPPYQFDRFQLVAWHPCPTEAEDRRAALAAYAAGNGGQIMYHQAAAPAPKRIIEYLPTWLHGPRR